MFKAFGPLLVTIKNTYQRGDSIYYQRAIPRALHGRYPHRLIKINLGPVDLPTAARRVAALNKEFEAEWSGLLAAPESSPQALKVHAAAPLQSFVVTPGSATAAVSQPKACWMHSMDVATSSVFLCTRRDLSPPKPPDKYIVRRALHET